MLKVLLGLVGKSLTITKTRKLRLTMTVGPSQCFTITFTRARTITMTKIMTTGLRQCFTIALTIREPASQIT